MCITSDLLSLCMKYSKMSDSYFVFHHGINFLLPEMDCVLSGVIYMHLMQSSVHILTCMYVYICMYNDFHYILCMVC